MFSISSDAIEVGCMSSVAAEVSGEIRLPDINMTDCIRSLTDYINCSHLKELYILSNITFHHQSYLKIFSIFKLCLIIKSNVRQK